MAAHESSALPSVRLFRVWSAIANVLRWRGPGGVVDWLLTGCLRPWVAWHVWQIFETDITDGVDAPFFDGEESLALRTIATADDALDLRAQLPSLERLPEREIVRRVLQGDALIVAALGDTPVGSMWISFVSGVPLAFDATWKVGEHEAVRYDSYVLPAHRGRRIHSVLNYGANCHARGRGVRRTLAAISVVNRQSLKLPKQNQREAVMTVSQIRLRGQQRSLRFAAGRRFDAHFMVVPRGTSGESSAGIVKKARGNRSVAAGWPSDVLIKREHAPGHRPCGPADGNRDRGRTPDACARPGGRDDRGGVDAQPFSQ
jgi:hypothetical protein